MLTASGKALMLACASGLLHWRGPAAVVGTVMAVHVNAVDGMALRTRSHIREKVGEIQPAIADANPAPSIVFPSDMARVKASLLHAGPDSVFARWARCARYLSMSQMRFARALATPAATTLDKATDEMRVRDELLRAAIAKAPPFCSPTVPLKDANYEAAESLA